MSKRKNKTSKLGDDGFTLVELTAVIFIIVILVMVIAPKLVSITDGAEKAICDVNRKQLESHFVANMFISGVNQRKMTSSLFEQFLNDNEDYDDLCPSHGGISYVGGEVRCDIHSVEDEDGAAPYI